MSVECRCCSIVPPYLLNKLVKDCDPEIRKRAAANIAALQRSRELKVAKATMIRVPPDGSALHASKTRRVFDCQGTSDLSAKLAMSEGDAPSGDIAVREAYEHAGITWDFFNRLFNRNSCDDRGKTLVSSVHYSENGQGFDNAIWNGQQMVYGDGGTIFGRMTQCLDVVAHELTHGVTQYSAALPYEMQSGALNEHFSDVFGVVCRQWHEKQSDPTTANWLVGDKLLLNGEALRSMKEPGSANADDPQPSHMKDYRELPNTDEYDYGGVHIYSGIPNKAFYLTAVAVGKPAWEDAAKIWYITLTQRLKGETSFEKCALETISVARDFFDDATAAKVAQAWKDVGVIVGSPGPVASLDVPPATKVTLSATSEKKAPVRAKRKRKS